MCVPQMALQRAGLNTWSIKLLTISIGPALSVRQHAPLPEDLWQVVHTPACPFSEIAQRAAHMCLVVMCMACTQREADGLGRCEYP